MKSTLLSISLFLWFIGTSNAQISYEEAQKIVKDYVDKHNIEKPGRSRNIYLDANDVIHIFLFENGNTILKGFPTTATEKNKFQVHLVVGSDTVIYRLDVVGSYEPTINIVKSSVGKKSTANVKPPPYSMVNFAVVGPFTNSVTFTLNQLQADKGYTPLISTNVKISKTIHASIGTGYFYSSLKNPANIRVSPLGSGETTLIADNSDGSASLAVMATLYPFGRNSLMMPSLPFKDRLGIAIGTAIASNKSNFKNLFFGLQCDFAIGGSIVAGADIAERQEISGINYNDFIFGETVFSGDLNNRLIKKVGVGIFVGVQVDSRIFSKMFE